MPAPAGPPAPAHVVDYYTGDFREDERLTAGARPQGRLEWIRTREILASVLPPAPARVLDVGGGPGAYARALTRDGYAVRLLDLTPAHVELARTGEPPVEAAVADARRLDEPAGGYDAVLLMGPLYHLTDRADRVAALREAVRVARPGAPVVAAVISRFAGPLDFGSLGAFDEAWAEQARRLVGSGSHDHREPRLRGRRAVGPRRGGVRLGAAAGAGARHRARAAAGQRAPAGGGHRAVVSRRPAAAGSVTRAACAASVGRLRFSRRAGCPPVRRPPRAGRPAPPRWSRARRRR